MARLACLSPVGVLNSWHRFSHSRILLRILALLRSGQTIGYLDPHATPAHYLTCRRNDPRVVLKRSHMPRPTEVGYVPETSTSFIVRFLKRVGHRLRRAESRFRGRGAISWPARPSGLRHHLQKRRRRGSGERASKMISSRL